MQPLPACPPQALHFVLTRPCLPVGTPGSNGGKASAVDSACKIQACDGAVVITRSSDGKLVTEDGFKRPALPGPRYALKQKTLDEDTYQDAVKAIIERDFFPEVPFIRAREELEHAMQSRDPLRISEAHANFRRCAATPGGRSMRTPRHGHSAPGTPMHGSRGATPASEFGGSVRPAHDETMDRADEVHRLTKDRRLDQFLHKYTSEDNQSASQLLLEDSVALEQSRMWVHEQALEYNTRQQKLIANGPRQEDGTLNMVLSAKYDESQSLMSLTPKTDYKATEARSRVGAQKEINTSGTRVNKSMLKRLQKAGMTGGTLHAAMAGVPGFVGVTGRLQEGADSPAAGGGPGGLAPSVPSSPRVGGYGFLVTPSPAPGEDDEPMFTWGAVDGTPLLLNDDDPMPGFQPFKVQEKTPKEEVAERMYKRAIVKKEARGEFRDLRQGMRGEGVAPGSGIAKSRPLTSTTPHHAGGSRAQTPVLSDAARRLASKMGIGPKSGSLDSQLRASYRGTTPRSGMHTPASLAGGTPRRSSMARPTGPTTPRTGSVEPARAAASEAPASSVAGVAGRQSAHLTDGLLQL